MRRRFVTLDVFTARRFCGNPLAVVFEPDGLDTAAMQTIAREFNYPETVFILRPANAGNRAQLRIFTPATELQFAGHPTVGTAVALARTSGGSQQKFVVEEKVGPVACEVALHDGDSGRASFALPKLPEQADFTPDNVVIASALDLAVADIGDGPFSPSRWSAGMAFTFVPVKSLAAIARARPDPDQFESAFGIGGPGKVYLFCRATLERGNNFHARMFAPTMGIPEDPATGSAAAAFIGLVAAHGGLGDGSHRLRIEQGYEMGRPSQIELAFTVAGGRLTQGAIGGDAVIVCEGAIEA